MMHPRHNSVGRSTCQPVKKNQDLSCYTLSISPTLLKQIQQQRLPAQLKINPHYWRINCMTYINCRYMFIISCLLLACHSSLFTLLSSQKLFSCVLWAFAAFCYLLSFFAVHLTSWSHRLKNKSTQSSKKWLLSSRGTQTPGPWVQILPCTQGSSTTSSSWAFSYSTFAFATEQALLWYFPWFAQLWHYNNMKNSNLMLKVIWDIFPAVIQVYFWTVVFE